MGQKVVSDEGGYVIKVTSDASLRLGYFKLPTRFYFKFKVLKIFLCSFSKHFKLKILSSGPIRTPGI